MKYVIHLQVTQYLNQDFTTAPYLNANLLMW